jgi:hypothetical protein
MSSTSNVNRNETEDRLAALRTFILERWHLFAGNPAQYPWPWESARWHELVFCLLFRLGEPELQPAMARTMTTILATLDLLRAERLAGLVDEKGEIDLDHVDVALMTQLLQRAGLDHSKTVTVITTLCQTALGLQRRYDGRVQGYLRHYGQLMLDAIPQDFAYSQAGVQDIRHAFTHWLQNVANLPVPISEPSVTRFCQANRVTSDELVRVADELDVNVAFLDDLVAHDWVPEASEIAADRVENPQ